MTDKAAGDATWTIKPDLPGTGTITVSRLDNRAGSRITLDQISGEWEWRCPHLRQNYEHPEGEWVVNPEAPTCKYTIVALQGGGYGLRGYPDVKVTYGQGATPDTLTIDMDTANSIMYLTGRYESGQIVGTARLMEGLFPDVIYNGPLVLTRVKE